MYAFLPVFRVSSLAKSRRFRFILLSSLALSLALSSGALAADPVPNVVEKLNSAFGSPEAFIANFESVIEDRSNQIMGLLIAAAGFTYAVRSFL